MKELEGIIEEVKEMRRRAKALALMAEGKTASQASYLAIDICCKVLIDKMEAALISIETRNFMERPQGSFAEKSKASAT